MQDLIINELLNIFMLVLFRAVVSAEIARIHCYGKGNAFRLMETHWSSVSAFAQYIWSGFFCYSSFISL